MSKKSKVLIGLLVVLYYLITIALVYVPALLNQVNEGVQPMSTDITQGIDYGILIGQILIFNTIILVIVLFFKYISYVILNGKFSTNLNMGYVLISVLVTLNVFAGVNVTSFNPLMMAVLDVLLIGLFHGMFGNKNGSLLIKVIIVELISALVIYVTAFVVLSIVVGMF